MGKKHTAPKGEEYLSPLKKNFAKKQIQDAQSSKSRQTFDNINDLRTYMENNTVNGNVKPSAVATIRIQARLILIIPETTKNGFKILRLYLTEKSSPEPFPEQKKDFFEAETVNTLDAHAAVITLTLFEFNLSDPRLPKEGQCHCLQPNQNKSVLAMLPSSSKVRDLCVVSSANEGTGETKTEDNE